MTVKPVIPGTLCLKGPSFGEMIAEMRATMNGQLDLFDLEQHSLKCLWS